MESQEKERTTAIFTHTPIDFEKVMQQQQGRIDIHQAFLFSPELTHQIYRKEEILEAENKSWPVLFSFVAETSNNQS